MKGFTERLTLLITWIGFLCFLVFVIYGLSGVITDAPEERLLAAAGEGVAFYICQLKSLISGKNGL